MVLENLKRYLLKEIRNYTNFIMKLLETKIFFFITYNKTKFTNNKSNPIDYNNKQKQNKKNNENINLKINTFSQNCFPNKDKNKSSLK